jgi:hypothetical protein
MRRAVAACVVLPLAAAGSLTAHALAYRLAEPRPGPRAQLLAETGHRYLEVLPLLAGLAGALLALALTLRVRESRRGATSGSPALLFAWLPLLAFTAQEHLERLVHDGVFPADAVLERTFLVGLALQLPFAAAALLLARLLLQAADGLGRALAGRAFRAVGSVRAARRSWPSVSPVRSLSRTLAPGPRAPPAAAC